MCRTYHNYSKFICFYTILYAGNPLPEVTWFKDKRQIDISYEATFTRVIQNTLELGPLSRSDQGRLDKISHQFD